MTLNFTSGFCKLLALLTISSKFLLFAEVIPESYEQLKKGHNFNTVEALYNPSQVLPATLNELFSSLAIRTLTLSMLSQNTNFSNNFELPHQKGVFLMLENQTQFDPETLKILGQLFLISRDTHFWAYLPEVGSVYVSNPNDKFCGQHLHNLVQIFAPCKANSGLFSLLNTETIFTKEFFGFTLQWAIDHLLIRLILPKSLKEIDRLETIDSSLPLECLTLKHQAIIKQSNLQDFHTNPSKNKPTLLDKFIPNLLEFSTSSQWYSREKALSLYLNKKTLREWKIPAENQPSINSTIFPASISFNLHFPQGFVVSSLNSNCRPEQHCQIMQIFSGRNSEFLTINTRIGNHFIQAAGNGLLISVKFKSYLKGFEQYETISGGGEQLMRIPTVLNFWKGSEFFLLPGEVSERLLEPDFSIPFHTTTFTVAVIGYLWVALWKTYFRCKSGSSPDLKSIKIHIQKK